MRAADTDGMDQFCDRCASALTSAAQFCGTCGAARPASAGRPALAQPAARRTLTGSNGAMVVAALLAVLVVAVLGVPTFLSWSDKQKAASLHTDADSVEQLVNNYFDAHPESRLVEFTHDGEPITIGFDTFEPSGSNSVSVHGLELGGQRKYCVSVSTYGIDTVAERGELC